MIRVVDESKGLFAQKDLKTYSQCKTLCKSVERKTRGKVRSTGIQASAGQGSCALCLLPFQAGILNDDMIWENTTF